MTDPQGWHSHTVTKDEYNDELGLAATCSHASGFDAYDHPEHCAGIVNPGETMMQNEDEMRLCQGCYEFLADAGEVAGGG